MTQLSIYLGTVITALTFVWSGAIKTHWYCKLCTGVLKDKRFSLMSYFFGYKSIINCAAQKGEFVKSIEFYIARKLLSLKHIFRVDLILLSWITKYITLGFFWRNSFFFPPSLFLLGLLLENSNQHLEASN